MVQNDVLICQTIKKKFNSAAATATNKISRHSLSQNFIQKYNKTHPTEYAMNLMFVSMTTTVSQQQGSVALQQTQDQFINSETVK